MKIISLQAENVKRLVAVEIKPDGNLVQITGKNGQGKTSVLDSIWWALAGTTNIQAAPIRKGAEEAKIRLDLGELKVVRTFRHGKDGNFTTSIAVENAEGARYPSPQKQIDALLGSLSFDPLGFARMEAKAQFEELKRFVPDVDFVAIANADRGDRERRTEIGRLAKQERSAAQLIVTPADTPEQEIDEAGLVSELEAAGKANAELEQRRANRTRLAGEAESARALVKGFSDDITDLREQIAGLEERIAKNTERAAAIDKQLNEAGPLPTPVDTAPIRKKIEDARAVNANVRKLTERMKHHTVAGELDKKYETLTAQIDQRNTDKEAAIAKAKMPVPCLGFGEGVVLFNGLPFEQASDAEQLRVSVAIAAALNPKLRVIRVRDGSLLDDDGMKLLGELATATDMQIWIEKVSSDGNVGFILEDGHVRKGTDDHDPAISTDKVKPSDSTAASSESGAA